MHQKSATDVKRSFATTETSSQWELASRADLMPIEPTTMVLTPTTLAQIESTLSYTMDSDMQSSDEDSNQEWTPADKQKTGQATRRCLPGPKSTIRTEDMTVEEIRRRDRRRERNKQAAARCRQRRLDITNQLLNETQQLEAEAQKLEREIENLRRQKQQLQFVLDAHRPTCRGDVPDVMTEIKPDSTVSLIPQTAARPNSLPISGQLVRQAASVISTVPQQFDFGLGSTGFTPIVSSSGVGVFLGTGTDIVSPTTLLLTPTSMAVQ